MTPYYQDELVTLYCGDCRDVLPQLPPGSVDTCITDPPYGLSFMGQHWDHGVPGRLFWKLTMEVLKPGAMLLAFGGDRTHHRLMCAIEDVGLEIRTCIYWIYGAGFPKSLDIGKQLDRRAGAERDESPREWSGGKRSNGIMGVNHGTQVRTIYDAPVTPEARLWDGWGTALKPSAEIITLAMVPLDGSFADNALRHGVAGLWVEGGRIACPPGDKGDWPQTNRAWGSTYGQSRPLLTNHSKGRWPSNVILGCACPDGVGHEPGCAVRMLDEQSGARTSGTLKPHHKANGTPSNSLSGGIDGSLNSHFGPSYGDTGPASRFYYCAKVSPSERGAGNDHPCLKPIALLRYLARLTKTHTGGAILDPFAGAGSTLLAARAEGRKAIGIEIDERYCEMAAERLSPGYRATRNGKATAGQMCFQF